MKVTCNAKEFVENISLLKGVVPGHSPMPVLAGILLQGSDSVITLTGSKLENAMRVEMAAEIEGEVEPLVLPGRKLIDICGKLPLEPDAVVVLEQQGAVVKLKYKRSTFTLHTQAPDEFPEFPAMPETDMSIPVDILKEVLSRTVIAVSTNRVRPMICGVYLKCEDTILTAVATDVKILVMATASYGFDFAGVIVPANAVKNILRVFSEGDMWLSVSNNQLICGQNGKTVSSLLIESEFVNEACDSLVALDWQDTFECDRVELLNAVESACLLSHKEYALLKLSADGDALVIESDLVNVGGSRQVVSAEFQGGMEPIGLNGIYLRKVLTDLSCERVKIGHGNPTDPLTLISVGNENYKCVIVPMQL